MMLRSRSLILDTEWTSFLNKYFHTVGPVWRRRPFCIIFMITPHAPRSIFLSLRAPSLKVYLTCKNFLLEKGHVHALCGGEMLLGRHSDHYEGSWLMEKQKQSEKVDGKWLRRAEPTTDNNTAPLDLSCPCGHQRKDYNHDLRINENAKDD